MRTTSLDSVSRSSSFAGADIDVLFEPGAEAHQLGVIRVAIPVGAALPTHDHGESEALLVPLDGKVVLCAADDGHEEPLRSGVIAVVAAYERVSVRNTGDQTAHMLVCMAPPTFVSALGRDPVAAQAGASS